MAIGNASKKPKHLFNGLVRQLYQTINAIRKRLNVAKTENI